MKGQRTNQFFSRHRLLKFIPADEPIRTRWMLGLATWSIVMPAIVATASYIDGTWILPGSGKGFMQHWGMWSFFATTPIVISLLWLLLYRFHTTLQINLHRYCVGGTVPAPLKQSIARHVASLTLRTSLKYVLALMCVIGVYFTVLNIRRTIEPLSTYGNDVFDAYRYSFGFVANKIYILFLFGMVYPVVGYVTIHTTVSLFLILKQMQRNKIFSIDFFHPDNCGGVSRFGTINVLVMLIYLCILGVIVSLLETHNYRERTTTVPLLCTSGFLILQSLGAVYYLHKAVQQQRRSALDRVNDTLNQKFSALTDEDFPNHLFAVRNHLLSVKTYPYSGVARSLVNGIRTAPAVWAVVRIWA